LFLAKREDGRYRERKIRNTGCARGQVKQQLAAARRDLETARGLLTSENEWAYNIAYNAMLLAGRAVMFSEGYRPTAAGGHAAVVEFLGICLDASFSEIVQTMDRMRGSVTGSPTMHLAPSHRARFARLSRVRSNFFHRSRN